MLVNIIGMILILWAYLLSWAGPELKTEGFDNRVKEILDVYRYVLLIAFIGAILYGIKWS